jgi:hypothetical protein
MILRTPNNILPPRSSAICINVIVPRVIHIIPNARIHPLSIDRCDTASFIFEEKKAIEARAIMNDARR